LSVANESELMYVNLAALHSGVAVSIYGCTLCNKPIVWLIWPLKDFVIEKVSMLYYCFSV